MPALVALKPRKTGHADAGDDAARDEKNESRRFVCRAIEGLPCHALKRPPSTAVTLSTLPPHGWRSAPLPCRRLRFREHVTARVRENRNSETFGEFRDGENVLPVRLVSTGQTFPMASKSATPKKQSERTESLAVRRRGSRPHSALPPAR